MRPPCTSHYSAPIPRAGQHNRPLSLIRDPAPIRALGRIPVIQLPSKPSLRRIVGRGSPEPRPEAQPARVRSTSSPAVSQRHRVVIAAANARHAHLAVCVGEMQRLARAVAPRRRMLGDAGVAADRHLGAVLMFMLSSREMGSSQ